MIILLSILPWYWNRTQNVPESPAALGNRTVVTTFFPAYDIARHLAGDRLTVVKLLPPGVEIHHFEPGPDAIALSSRAALFIYGGPMLEPLAAKLTRELGLQDRTVDLSRHVALRSATGDPIRTEEIPAGTSYDPHYWLDIDNLAVMVEDIRTALSGIAPEETDYFNEQAGKYIQELARLDQEYRVGLSGCRQHRIILGGHRTFAYMAARYGLELVTVEGLDPEAEAKPKDLAAAIKEIKESGQNTVYTEEIIDARVAEAIAAETGAQVLYLHGLHNLTLDDERLGVDLFTLLANDLSQLKNGLQCRQGL